jgi:hypothetical protein
VRNCWVREISHASAEPAMDTVLSHLKKILITSHTCAAVECREILQRRQLPAQNKNAIFNLVIDIDAIQIVLEDEARKVIRSRDRINSS